jgi:RNA-directed DNA polymerase
MELQMGNTYSTQRRENVLTKQKQIAEIAKRYPNEAITSIHHHMDLEWLEEAAQRVNQKSAPGVDGVTVEEYQEELAANLPRLLNQAKGGAYKAPPVRRLNIPKGGKGKETRPIGIPTTEDKILQRAVVMLLAPIYEQEFCDFSYGFREGRSAQQALEYLWQKIMKRRMRWILDLDIRKFFDRMVHTQLREILGKRVRDGVITRLIGKWLKAGVLEGKKLFFPTEGSPQGGVISPLLSNVYLHEVLDKWYEDEVVHRLKGKSFMVRFADDVVMGFERKEDAARVLAVISKRLAKYGLSMHPEKTRLFPFLPPGPRGRGGQQEELKKETFDYLGFTHYWGYSKNGKWIVKRKTMQSRFSRGIRRIYEWCRTHRHMKIRNQHRKLVEMLDGHYTYYGITGNGWWIERFRETVKKIWRKWLHRRSRIRAMSWDRFNVLVHTVFKFPPARVVHSIYAAKP